MIFMKYLVWPILAALYTVIEMILFVLILFGWIIWNLELPAKKPWKTAHTMEAFQNDFGGYRFSDSNPWYSFKRRAFLMFKDFSSNVAVIDAKIVINPEQETYWDDEDEPNF